MRLILSLALFVGMATLATAGTDDDATTHHRFEDVKHWVDVFDDPTRAEWQKPAELVEALNILEGMVVVDIGAGTGYFNPFLSRAAGPQGRVLALDLEPGLVAHMNERAKREETSNVTARQCASDDAGLELHSVDRILIVNTYHHFDDRHDYFSRLRQALTPDGTVSIVDFKKIALPVGPPVEHKLAREQIVTEMEHAGYRLVKEPDVLPYQNFLVFADRDIQTPDKSMLGPAK
jgi:ubiquinone/menaquinone biosynthesis C-methylase UbiE